MQEYEGETEEISLVSSSACISVRTRHAPQPTEPPGVPGAATERKEVVICTHKQTDRLGECMRAHRQSHTHKNRLHPTPPLHRKSCPVLTGAHLPQPQAIQHPHHHHPKPPTQCSLSASHFPLLLSSPPSPSLSLFTSLSVF